MNIRTNGKEWKICLSDVFAIAEETGYPRDIQDKICQETYESLVDNWDGKANEYDIRGSLLYYYINSDNKIYYDMRDPLYNAVPGELHPMTADDFVYETMIEELRYYDYNEFDTAEKIKAIGDELVKHLTW